jgi:putative endonuclease
MYYLYILKSLKNARYYIGSTDDPKRRLAEHNAGKTPSLKHIRPLEIVFTHECKDRIEARRLEAKLKKYKNRTILDQIVADQKLRNTET